MDKILLDDFALIQASDIGTMNQGKKFENLPDIDDDDEFVDDDPYYEEEEDEAPFDEEPEMENLDGTIDEPFDDDDEDY